MLDILRNTPELKDTKVIMLTALGQAEDQTRANKLGADRYLVKSQVTLEDIVKVSHELLGEDDPSTADSEVESPTVTTTTTQATAPASQESTATAVQDTPAPTPAVEPVAVTPEPEPTPQDAIELPSPHQNNTPTAEPVTSSDSPSALQADDQIANNNQINQTINTSLNQSPPQPLSTPPDNTAQPFNMPEPTADPLQSATPQTDNQATLQDMPTTPNLQIAIDESGKLSQTEAEENTVMNQQIADFLEHTPDTSDMAPTNQPSVSTTAAMDSQPTIAQAANDQTLAQAVNDLMSANPPAQPTPATQPATSPRKGRKKSSVRSL